MSKKAKKENVELDVMKEETSENVEVQTEEGTDIPSEEPAAPEKKKLGKLAKIGIGAAIAAVSTIVVEVVRSVRGKPTEDIPEGVAESTDEVVNSEEEPSEE